MSRRLLLLLLVLPFGVRADDAVAATPEMHDDLVEEPLRPRTFDYSRFSDGPRRVPDARGASRARAEALGLGTRESATRLLHGRPDPRWVAAAAEGGQQMAAHLLWPVELGRFGRGFGYVRVTRPDLRHDGVDIVADEGSVVRAAADGIVAYSDNGIRGYGNVVLIVHPNGWVSLYAHNYRTTVQAGWRVRRGERIAFVGSTGISRGPHLHFELRQNGHALNPLSHFEGRPWIAAYGEWQRQRAAGVATSTEHLAAALPPDRPAAAPDSPTVAASTDFGSVASLRRLLEHGPTDSQLRDVEGAVYRTLLWPVRGGELHGNAGRGVNIRADIGTPVRAAADGLVVFAGEGLRGMGRAVALLHKNGWITLYGSNEELHVEAGQHVQRGEWIARVGASGGAAHLHFQLRDRGTAPDPTPLFVQRPS